MKSGAEIKRIEDGIQKAAVELLWIYERQGKLRFFAIPNGGGRPKPEAAIMVGLVVRAGVGDLMVMWRPTLVLAPCFGFLETKAPGRKPSPAQEDFRDWCYAAGIPWHLYFDAAELPAILKSWGAL